MIPNEEKLQYKIVSPVQTEKSIKKTVFPIEIEPIKKFDEIGAQNQIKFLLNNQFRL